MGEQSGRAQGSASPGESSGGGPRGSGADWSEGVRRALAETEADQPAARSMVIDTSVAHPARRYDYWLGGKTHYAADRESGDAVEAAFPAIRTAVLENRRFLRRAVSVLVRDFGVTQFMDIGTGIPSPGNTHEVAQSIIPQTRVFYADNDPVVLTHSQALLNSSDAGRAAYVQADLRDPSTILDHPALAATLDLSRPVALVLVAVLHFLLDADRPYAVVHQMLRALPPGSFLVLSHATYDFMSPRSLGDLDGAMTPRTGPFRPRTRADVERFFTGLELLPPGLCPVNQWRADDEAAPRPTNEQTAVYGGIARIP
jgi:SAM-dependent methyltransferase